MLQVIKKIGARFVWRKEASKVQTLLRFARTEAGGAVDIAQALAHVEDPVFAIQMKKHLDDEERHAEMFRQRAREVFGDPNGRTPAPESLGSDMAPTSMAAERGDLDLTDHGFLPSNNFEQLGIVRYVAMLYLAERDAAADFKLHYNATKDHDPETAAMFLSIMRDEDFHCAYTLRQLEQWRKEGRADEVKRALRAMHWFRFKARWTQMAQRIGDLMGGVVLRVLYLTVFAPFGLIGRSTRRQLGWVAQRRQPAKTMAQLRQSA